MLTIILPTYNERDNIEASVNRIVQSGIDAHILIIDDNSPDGTWKIAKKIKKYNKNVSVVRRDFERGLGSAIKLGLTTSDGIIGVMDADLSHDPSILPHIAKKFEEGADFVIGSRYIHGGGVDEWGFYRRVISKIATFMVRPITHVKDPLSGYFFVKKSVVNSLEINPESCKICLDILVRGNYKKVCEIPYLFVNRRFGKSKILNSSQILKYMKYVVYLYYFRLKKCIS
ncbi:MAG TPA: polyprenol monophosphomannose synthase [archaeon]|nr:polyprenol monophosphomannose synthase [archaeon]